MDVTHKYPFIYSTPIRWGEMDALGHLNNTVYFRYSEEARIQLFNSSGINVRLDDSFGPILAYIDCQFQMPVVFPNTLVFGSWIRDIGNTSMQIYHDVYSREYDRIVAQLKSVVVMVAYDTGQKVPISQTLRKAIGEHQIGFDLVAMDR